MDQYTQVLSLNPHHVYSSVIKAYNYKSDVYKDITNYFAFYFMGMYF